MKKTYKIDVDCGNVTLHPTGLLCNFSTATVFAVLEVQKIFGE